MGAQQLAGIRARLAEFDAAEAWLHDDDDDDDGDNYLYESPLDDSDGSYDWSAVHRALPSTGEKWVANHWFRIGGLGAPTPDPREDV